jgi:hypothetical protein
MPAPVAFLAGTLQYFPVDAQSETFLARRVTQGDTAGIDDSHRDSQMRNRT